MLVFPAPGLSVRDPILLDLIPAEGRDMPDSPTLQRALRDGDLVAARPSPARATPAQEA
jgi:hypothetical protein